MALRDSSIEEKFDHKNIPSIEHVEQSSTTKIDDADGELLLPERRSVAEKKLVRMLDLRLLPTIVLVFILNYIDVSFHCVIAYTES